MPAGLPEASEAWLSEAMGEICGRKEGMASRERADPAPPPPLALLPHSSAPPLSICQSVTWPCTGLNPYLGKGSFFVQGKPTWDRMAFWSLLWLLGILFGWPLFCAILSQTELEYESSTILLILDKTMQSLFSTFKTRFWIQQISSLLSFYSADF